MNGTVSPVSVVVFAICESGGGLAGASSSNGEATWLPAAEIDEPPVAGRYWYVVTGSALHCASRAPAWHCHGWICGPLNSGPPLGGVVSASCAPPFGVRAVTVLFPSFSPVTSPTTSPSGPTPKARVWSAPAAVTFRPEVVRTPRRPTSASPPETRSARPDSTLTLTAGLLAMRGA